MNGLGDGQLQPDHAYGEAADEIDRHNDNASYCVAADEFGSAVHGSVKVGFAFYLAAAAPGLLLIYETCVQVGIDGHLLARHLVQGEPGCDFRHSLRT